ncbi:metalloregulator ArsR/SmtB family transcription factor [Shimazuella sp. AN120528]|uniref:ArsR/SmtB family transcription factor n=1 Tax=Shimazuella soli TaxID=1892854 RepID=UPI001F110640|nr:metalloregulator ArsR/SmtB family transcription factor [Shimazuella soli]MCH5586195.1 metalloregulator ArsR/SmtB family transcription factor [Shimazuella soli]
MNETLQALAEPNRFKIVELLKKGPLTVGEIADSLHLRQPQVSKHLKVLSEAGLVQVQPEANRRIYKLRAQPFQEFQNWLHSFQQIWEGRLDSLDVYLQKLQNKKKK